jgi:hypothetical protein
VKVAISRRASASRASLSACVAAGDMGATGSLPRKYCFGWVGLHAAKADPSDGKLRRLLIAGSSGQARG